MNALKHEIVTDPAGMGYAGESAEEIAVMLNAPTRTVRDVVGKDVLQNALMQIPIAGDVLWFVLMDAAENNQSPLHALAKRVVFTVQESLLIGLNLDNPGIIAMMGALEQAGLLTAEQKASILSLGDKRISRAEEIGLGGVTPLDVSNALAEVD